MADLDFDLQLGTAENVDFADATATTNNKVMFVLFSDKSVVLVKNSVLKGGSTDEITITDNTKYTVKFTIADIEKLSGLQNLTYELHRWELLPQQPYTSLIYSGDVELLSRSGESEFTFAITPQTVGFANCSLASLLSFVSLSGFALLDNRVIVTTDDKVVLQKADGSLQEIGNNPNVGGLLGALAQLSRIDGYSEILKGANLESANLTGADLFGADLTNANLVGANLADANLADANLAGADLFGAILTNADLTNATLPNANLESANLESANLENAYLTGANLRDANLENAYLTGANLENVNLTGATMPSNADTKAEFKAVVGEGNWDAVTTIWIDGNPIG